MLRPIIKYGHSVLQQAAQPVLELTDEVQTLVNDLVETMYAAPGVGLAAPQIGVPLRVFVIDTSLGHDPAALVALINPEVIERDGMQLEEEGCLSVPGFTATVARPRFVKIKGLDRNGVERVLEGTGLLARALHHELDHLDGRLFVDRLRGIKRDMIVRKVRKLARAGQW
ncbi:MAG: peptide deformylase [Acidobacteria bacterium]|nr:peptide deformylase [Acidobacteriota bacterium]